MSLSASAAAPKRVELSSVPVSRGPFQSQATHTLLLCLLLTVVVLVSYNPVTRNGFLSWDDDAYITDNVHVKAGLTWTTVKWAFTTDYQANWAPLSWLSHALDFELFGLNPAGHHYMSVCIHSINVVLLFLLLQSATGFQWRSLMVAALFALHPINVESVAWVAERKNVLSMLFFLLALHAYVWYTRKPMLLRYAVLFFLFALGLLSKSQIITFPFLLWLWDYWPLNRIFPSAAADTGMRRGKPTALWRGWLVMEKVPLLLLCAATAVVTTKAEKAGGAIKTFSEYSLLLRLEIAAISYARYLENALWPLRLVALYPRPAKLYPAWQVGAAVSLLLLITALVFRARHQRYLTVGWFWFLGSLVPMIGLVQVGAQAMADRFAYLPFIGLFLMLVWLAADGAKALQIPATWVAVSALSCLLVLGTLTYRQVGYWHDTESFWIRTLALTHDNYVAHDELGDFLFAHDRSEEAAQHYRAALAIRHDDLPASLNLGAYEQGHGNLPAAISLYQTVAQYAGNTELRGTAYGNLGSAYRQTGQLSLAKQCYDTALQLTPNRTMAMIGLGLIAQKNGDYTEAVLQYSRAMAIQPTDVGFLLVAQALQHQGKIDEAKAIFERVERLSPNLAEARRVEESLLAGS